jgi:hypothetical protein
LTVLIDEVERLTLLDGQPQPERQQAREERRELAHGQLVNRR